MRRRLTTDLEEYLRERMRRWLADDQRRTAAELAATAGVSEGHLSNWYNRNRGLGSETATGLCAAFGLTWEELVDQARDWNPGQRVAAGPTPPPPSDVTPVGERRRYQDLPGWVEAAALVAAEERAPAYAIEAAGRGILSWPVRAVTADFVVDEALRWLKHAPFEVRRAAETAAAQVKSEAEVHQSGNVATKPTPPTRKAR